MTMCERFPTWREAFDYAQAEMKSPEYRCWGWAVVTKDDGHGCADDGGCGEWCQHQGNWCAEIA